MGLCVVLGACAGDADDPNEDVGLPTSENEDRAFDGGEPTVDGGHAADAGAGERAWDDVDAFIEDQMTSANIAGLAVAVTRPGEVVWTGAYGWANVEDNLAASVNTPFMLASVSKTVTGVAMMHVWEEGILTLDAEINSLLPFTVDNPQVEDEIIQVRHLVGHTSGIRDNWGNMPYFDGDSPHALGDYLEGYLVEGGDWYHADNNFSDHLPGVAFEYGNIATALAGYVVEVATETPFDEYCDTHIFDVLGMENTGWHLADFDPSEVAMPYQYTGGEYVTDGHYGYADYPDGQLRSSISDMARFLAAVSNEGVLGDDRVLSSDTVSEMLSPPVPTVDAGQYVFWYSGTMAGRSVIGHNGSDQGVATQMGFSPETGIGVILLMNVSWNGVGDAADAIIEILFETAEGL